MLQNENPFKKSESRIRLPKTAQALAFAALGTILALTGSVEADDPKPKATPTIFDSSAINHEHNQIPSGSNGSTEKAPTTTSVSIPNPNKPGSIIVRRSDVVREQVRSGGISTLAVGENLAGGAIDYNVIRNVDNVEQTIAEYRARGIYTEIDHEVKALEIPKPEWQESLPQSIFFLQNPKPTAYEGLPPDLTLMEFPAAWSVTRGKDQTGKPTRIAILDTGIGSHIDLDGKVVAAYDVTNSSYGPIDRHGHGTHVAGLAAARMNNNVEISGGAPDAELVNIKVLGDGGTGSFTTVIRGIDLARNIPGVKVISMSLGANLECTPALQAIVDLATADGISILAAAGNDGLNDIHTPANCIGVIPVGSVNPDGSISSFSNRIGSQYGDRIIFARGTLLKSTMPWNNAYASLSGTSMATPRAAALFALLRTNLYSDNPSGALTRVLQNLDSIPNYSGNGRINARRTFGLPVQSYETATPVIPPTPTNTPTACEAPLVIRTENKGSHLLSTMQARSGNFGEPPFIELNSNREASRGIITLVSGGTNFDFMTLRIDRYTQDGPITLPLDIKDACPKPWRTVIGFGMGPNRPWTQTPTQIVTPAQR